MTRALKDQHCHTGLAWVLGEGVPRRTWPLIERQAGEVAGPETPQREEGGRDPLSLACW